MRLACPVVGCKGRFEVSEEDADSTLSDVYRHLLGAAHGFMEHGPAQALLAQVRTAPEDSLGPQHDVVVTHRPVTG